MRYRRDPFLGTRQRGSQHFTELAVHELLIDLGRSTPHSFSSRRIIECVPALFAGDREAHIAWKTTLAARLGVDPYALVVVGSASCGISLNPTKHFRPFDGESDVDVAAISSFHFDTAWHWLRSLGSKRYGLPPRAQQSVADHVSKYIYFGTVATDKILQYLPFGPEWVLALNDQAAIPPTEGREIKVRLYRDFESLRSYHVSNLRKLQALLPVNDSQTT